jgi:hypothetical protein
VVVQWAAGSVTTVLDAILASCCTCARHAALSEAALGHAARGCSCTSACGAYAGCSYGAAEQACAAAASACCCSFGTAIYLLLVQRVSLQEMHTQLCGAQLGMPGGTKQLVLMLCCYYV